MIERHERSVWTRWPNRRSGCCQEPASRHWPSAGVGRCSHDMLQPGGRRGAGVASDHRGVWSAAGCGSASRCRRRRQGRGMGATNAIIRRCSKRTV